MRKRTWPTSGAGSTAAGSQPTQATAATRTHRLHLRVYCLRCGAGCSPLRIGGSGRPQVSRATFHGVLPRCGHIAGQPEVIPRTLVHTAVATPPVQGKPERLS